MALIPSGRLLLKMLAFFAIVFVVIALAVALSSVNRTALGGGAPNQYLPYIALVIPLGLFAFIIYKFGKAGLTAILYFLGAVAAIYGLISLVTNPYSGMIALVLGAVFIAASWSLRKAWRIGKARMYEKGAAE